MPRSFLVRSYFRKRDYWISDIHVDDEINDAAHDRTNFGIENRRGVGADVSEYAHTLTTSISDYEEEKLYWFELDSKKENLSNLYDKKLKNTIETGRIQKCDIGNVENKEEIENTEALYSTAKYPSSRKHEWDNIEGKLNQMLGENQDIVKKNIKQFLENNRILAKEIAAETGLNEENINIYIDGKEKFNEDQTKDFYRWYLKKIYRPPNGTGDEKSFTCYKCGKIFAYQSYLERHIKYVCPDNTGRTWKCSYCGKAFQYPCYLRRHVRSHTGESPYKCDKCDRAFVRSTDLQRHIRNHTGEKPYKCTECHRAFARSTDLKRHMRTHTGEKPYKCWQCGKTFSQSGSLQTHLHTHNKDGNGGRKHAKGSK